MVHFIFGLQNKIDLILEENDPHSYCMSWNLLALLSSVSTHTVFPLYTSNITFVVVDSWERCGPQGQVLVCLFRIRIQNKIAEDKYSAASGKYGVVPDTAFVFLFIQNCAPWSLTRSTQSGKAEPLTVISAHLSGAMKNGEDKDCEKLFEQVQALAAETVGQISNCNSSF